MAERKSNMRPMGRGGRFRGPHGRPDNLKSAVARLMHYMAEYRCFMLLVAALIAVSSLTQVVGVSYIQRIVDEYLAPLASQFAQSGNVDAELQRGFLRTILTIAFIFAFGAFSTFAYARLMLRISTGTLLRLRKDTFQRMETLPIKYFDTQSHGDIMSRYTNDIDAVRDMISNSVAGFISSGITVVSVFIMMLYYSWMLTLLVLIMLFGMLAVSGKIAKRSGNYFRKQQAALGKLNGYIEEMIEGSKVVKVFCREDKVQEEFDSLNETMRAASTSANTFAGLMAPLNGNLSHAMYAVIAIVGCIMVINGFGGLTLGTLLAFLQYTRSFSQPVAQVSQQLNSVLNALAGAERVFALIDQPSEADNGSVTLSTPSEDAGCAAALAGTDCRWAWKQSDGSQSKYIPVHGDVLFDNVTFGYTPEKAVLHGISLHALPGQKIALVGSTGAGKTTITNLLNRFYDIAQGHIYYDGISIDDICKSDLRRSLSMVLQDTHLFTGTVMDNIRYGRLDATDDEVHAAARLANADGFIARLPKGYDTLLTQDGGNLSQGQRQLLAIARAAVADPPVLILDEATSSIDTRTEQLVQRGMNRLMQGRTVFIIAHRLSTVRSADMILVLEQGEIIERGRHDELIAAHGRYYQLYTGLQELN